jgi:Divergent InlB B-repeat domain
MRKLRVPLILCFVVLYASAVHSQTNTGMNNAQLNGNYAFTLNGITGNGSISSVFGAVGRFTADGAGNLTNGELVTNTAGAGATSARSFTGTYSIGADNRGVMTLNMSGTTARLAFAMMANGSAQLIEFDASGGTGTIGSGTIEKADTTAYSTARITGDYAFGAAGFDNANNRAAIAGRFTSNGTGTLTNAAGDVNAYGSDYSMNFTAANYTVSNTATGRGTMSLAFTFGGTPDTLNFVFYIVNSGKLFVMESDPVTMGTPLLNGALVQQQIPAGGFSNASLSGDMVIYLTGLSHCGSGTGVPKVGAGLLTANGSGALSLTWDENYCGAPNSLTNAAGTYSVATNGRTSITIGGNILVAYLVSLNQAFLFDFDSNVLFGFGQPQAAGSLTNSSLKGTYAGFTTNPANFGVVVFSGEFAADGAAPSGNMTGTEDIGASSGPVSGAAFKATYSISPSPTNGRGTMTVTSGTGGNAVIYMISPSKFVAVSVNDPNAAVLDFEQSSVNAAPNYALSASPSSVTITRGSSGRSAVTVTPQNGFSGSVSLSASALPSGVTAAFNPNPTTSATNSSTLTLTANSAATTGTVTVTITGTSGSLAHATTLTLTVNPATPPPNYTLSASPSSVTITRGSSGRSAVTVTPQNGFNGSVSLSASGLPSGVTAAFNPNPTTSATNSSTLTLTANSAATTGTVTVTITGTSGTLTHTTTLTLTVNALYTLTVSDTGLGSGTVTSSPAGIDCGSTCSASYVSGTTVTLTATPNSLSGFGGWSGCDAVSGNTCTVNMNSARSVTADFALLGVL